MAVQLTEKENYLMTLRGEEPEWVPTYSFGPMPGMTRPCTNAIFTPPFIGKFRFQGGGKDVWGVNYVPSDSTGKAILPEPGNFILDDISHWHDVIKAPDLSGIDWEQQVKDGMEGLYKMGFNRDDSCLSYNMHAGYFQDLVAFMGFENGLCALYEEPEECKALMDYICDWYTTVEARIIDLVKPDVLTLMDDVATWRNPFFSEETYREIFLPCHDREAKFARERNMPITMHCCGRGEPFIEDWLSIGVNAWDPAQTSNDLKAIKAKYGNRFVLMGAWDSRGRLLEDDVTDEEIRQSVRDTLDTYAKGGGFCWCGGYLGAVGDQEIVRRNTVLFDEVNSYGDAFYGFGPEVHKVYGHYGK